MKNLKISRKLSLSFLIVIALTIIPTVVSLFAINRLANAALNNYNTITYPLDEMVRFSIAYGNVRSAMRDLGRSTDAADNQRHVATIELNLDLSIQHLEVYYSIFAEHFTTQEEYETVRSVYQAMREYAAVVRTHMIPAGLANDNERVFEILFTDLAPIGTIIRIDIENLTELNSHQGRESAERATSDLRASVITSVVILIAVIALVIILAVYLSSQISKPIKKVSTILSEVANGNLNVNINRANLSKDEIGLLTQSMCNLVDTIEAIHDDVLEFTHHHNDLGDFEFEMNKDKFKGAFKELVDAISVTHKGAEDEGWLYHEAMTDIGNGVFDKKMKQMPGKRIITNQAIEKLQGIMQELTSDLNMMIEAAAVKGDLNFHVDENKYDGGWRTIVKGLNDIAAAVAEPIRCLEIALREMEKGNFDLESVDAVIESNGVTAAASHYKGVFNIVVKAIDTSFINVSSYINEVSEVLAKMAQGNLTVQITRDYIGDFVAIKDSINNISTTLNKTMSEISSSAAQVLSGANQISASATNLANGASEQASSVEELNASIDMINQQTKQNADDAKAASTLSDESTQNAQKGNESVNQMLEAMIKIKESSSNISRIIKAIQEIAFQTNLLALNASVEAARAGEHGKGFSVVAEEVRNLAARSQLAATESTELIEDSINHVDIGSGIAETTAEALNSIVVSANEVLQVIDGIAVSSRDQAEAIAQVVTGLEQISAVVQSNSAVSEETAAAAEELNSQAELLRQLVAYFKL